LVIASEGIVTQTAPEDVVTVITPDPIITVFSEERIVPRLAANAIVASTAVDQVITAGLPRLGITRVAIAAQHIIAISTVDDKLNGA